MIKNSGFVNLKRGRGMVLKLLLLDDGVEDYFTGVIRQLNHERVIR